MVRVVGVRFKMAGKVYYFDPADLPITAGNKVIVETVRGVEYGEVVVGPKDVDDDQVVQPLKKVIRIGTERDAQIALDNKRKEKEAFAAALKKIEGHNLDMYLVDVEYTFDGSKIIFYFTAEGRVDFRELVRDLASLFRARIEMRQIGVRDEAKLLGGIGPCGRILCCTSFLGDFAPVSIRMAKDQNLSLNPSKISGLCGRLMCCLRYEQETYEAAKKDPTLAPGYVPPVQILDPETPPLDELEDRPAPAIGIRNRTSSGLSARVAQAAAVIEKPEIRREKPRPGGGDGPGRLEQLPGERLSGARFTPDRPGEGREQRSGGGPKGQPRHPEGGRKEGRPHGGERPGSPQQSKPKGQGGRPQEQGGQRPHEPGRKEGRHQGQSGGQQQGGRPQPERNQGHPKGQPQPPRAQHPPRPQEQGAPQAQAGQPAGERQGGGGNRRRRRRRGPRPDGGQQGAPTKTE